MNDNVRTFGGDDTDETSADQFNNESNVMDDLREALSDTVEVEELTLKVPSRPTIEMVFQPDLEFDLLRSFMKSAANNKKKQFNPLVFAFAVISKTNTEIRIKGKVARDSEGTPLTIVHKQFRDMLSAHDVPNAIKKLYGIEGHIIGVGQEIVEAAGYGDIDMEGGTDPLGL